MTATTSKKKMWLRFLELSSKKGKIKMLCYKGFDKDLKCRDFQYETGKKYSEESAEICEKGFHACEFPLDVFGYYAPSDSRYCEVDLDANDQKSDDSKRVGKSISIKAEIGIAGIIKAGVEYIKNQVDWNNDKKTNTGYCSAATNTGNRSVATNTGNRSVATNTGDCSAATNTGDCSAATVEGKESVAIAIGYDSKVKGSIGCFIVLAEWKKFEDGTYHIVDVKSAKVDGTKIKPDTFYKLVNGEFIAEE
nr:MAG TPA: hypothetical protein [Caudoviricetes sp.]